MKRPLDELRGEAVEALLAFEANSGPEMLLVQLRPSGWWRGFVEWGRTWLDPIDDEDRRSMLSDYAGIPSIDYAARFGLVGAVIERVEISEEAGDVATEQSLTFELDRGTLTLSLVDPSDFDSDSRLTWTPRHAQG